MPAVVAAAVAGIGHVARERHVAFAAFDADQAVRQVLPEEAGDPISPIVGRRKIVEWPAIVAEGEVDLRMCEREPCEGLR